ncbi:MAG: VC0807 family protein [Bordetella sp.]|uniref:VC0807 family protein n=1 Tax=Bordetella sp. TaxID=28081 RepID=UPI003F7C0C64
MKIKPGILVELAVNFLLPWLVYRWALPRYGETGALYASAVPPIVWSIVEFMRLRRVDVMSLFVLAGIVLSIVAMMLGGDSRALLIRESFASGAFGVAFLLSLALRRPLVFYLARATVARQSEDDIARFEAAWAERPALRRSLRLMTAAWGAGLTLEMALRVWLVWHLSVERVLVVSPFISYAIYGALMLWTLWYRRRLRSNPQAA